VGALNIAIVGMGFMGRLSARILKQTPGATDAIERSRAGERAIQLD
jgi:prephenate dehydrogenase